MAVNTSAQSPLPVGEVSRLIGGWIDRLGAVWVIQLYKGVGEMRENRLVVDVFKAGPGDYQELV
ncbi:hypothetical protein ACWEQU_34700, partial [Streptomyces nodosus]